MTTYPKIGLLLSLALLLSCSQCYKYRGLDVFDTASTSTPTDCTLRLKDTVTETSINFEQTGDQANCQWSNLRFYSFFRGDELNDAVPFNAPVNGVLTASMDAAALQRNNGTGCVYLAQTEVASDLHVCRFGFSQIRFFLAAYGTGNYTFAPSVREILLTNYENDLIVSADQNLIAPRDGLPNIVVDLHPACGSTNNTISHPATIISFTTSENLTEHLFNFTFSHILVRRSNSFTPGDYLTIKSPTADRLFMDPSESGCFVTPLVYNSILPNPDLSYCTGGCKISFVLTNNAGDFYLLQTNGIVTTLFDTNGGSNNGGNDGGNTGGGAGVGTGIGSGNGTNGGVVSSSMSLGFNLFVVLLLSFVYLH